MLWLMLCKSLLILFSVGFGSVTVENSDLSSTNDFEFEIRLFDRSLI